LDGKVGEGGGELLKNFGTKFFYIYDREMGR
jgi:hypothetical protein